MRIHQLCQNIEEYKRLFMSFYKFTEFDPEGDGLIWKKEDKQLLDVWFKFCNTEGKWLEKDWTPEIKTSFEYWKKCKKEYADEEFKKKESVRFFSPEELMELFYLTDNWVDDGEGDPPDITPDILTFIVDFKINFPCVVVGTIDSDYSQGSRCSVGYLDFVEEKEFFK